MILYAAVGFFLLLAIAIGKLAALQGFAVSRLDYSNHYNNRHALFKQYLCIASDTAFHSNSRSCALRVTPCGHFLRMSEGLSTALM